MSKELLGKILNREKTTANAVMNIMDEIKDNYEDLSHEAIIEMHGFMMVLLLSNIDQTLTTIAAIEAIKLEDECETEGLE